MRGLDWIRAKVTLPKVFGPAGQAGTKGVGQWEAQRSLSQRILRGEDAAGNGGRRWLMLAGFPVEISSWPHGRWGGANQCLPYCFAPLPSAKSAGTELRLAYLRAIATLLQWFHYRDPPGPVSQNP